MVKTIHSYKSRAHKKEKNDLKKKFKLMNNAVFGKTIESMRKHRDIVLLTTQRRRNYLVSGPNYHTKIFFSESLLAIKMKRTQIFINKPVDLGLSVL